MASKKSTTDEFGNEIPKVPKKTGSKTTRTIRSSKAEKQGSRAGSSLRARGIEKGNTAGRRSIKNMTTARSSGAESKVARGKGTTQSARAAGYKRSMSGGTVRSSKADKAAGSGSNKSLRAQGVNEGRVSRAKPSSYPQSARAAGYKKATTGGNSSFRSNRFGKGKRGGSAQVTPRSNQSMRAAEYKKKHPGKY